MFPQSRRVVARDGLEPLLLSGLDGLGCRQRARLTFDRLQVGRFDAGDPMLLEAPRLGKPLPLERADRLVVGVDGTFERAAELREVRAHRGEALVELAPESRDVARALRERLLLPRH